MADPRTARPVSGEIMAADPATVRTARSVPQEDCVEADFEVVGAAAGIASGAPSGADGKRDMGDGMDMLRGAEALARPAAARTSGGPLFWSVGIAAVLAAFWISGGHAVVSAAVAPSAARVAPMLVVSDVTTRVDVSGPKPVLFVDGTAGNTGGAVSVMSELEIRVTGRDGKVTRYNLGTAGRTLAPGERFAFSSRLDLPKNGVESVSVSFSE